MDQTHSSILTHYKDTENIRIFKGVEKAKGRNKDYIQRQNDE